MVTETAYCPKCAQNKVLDEFNKNKARYSGRDSYCRLCMREIGRTRDRARVLDSVPPERQCMVEGCTTRRKGHGYCNRHLKRFRQHGTTELAKVDKRSVAAKRRPNGQTLEEAFRWFMPGEPPAKDVPWMWSGPVDGKGYGIIRFQGRNVLAHRIAYELFVGPIAEGLVIRHKDDTPLNVNPHNLEPGTLADNVRDRVERGRTHRGPRNPAHGSKHVRAALTEEDIVAIRSASATGVKQWELAVRYGVGQPAISAIVNRKVWAHVP